MMRQLAVGAFFLAALSLTACVSTTPTVSPAPAKHRTLTAPHIPAISRLPTAPTAPMMAAVPAVPEKMVASTVPTVPTEAGPKCVALTFDDGPNPRTTPRLLNILEQEHVRATFFVVGEMAKHHPEIVKREFADGNEIGNHTWSHAWMTKLSNAADLRQVGKTDALLEHITGVRPPVIRLPYGAVNSRLRKLFSRRFVFWDVDTLDWKYRNPNHVYAAAIKARPGDIVLMHDIHATTVAAVKRIIDNFKSRGFSFATVAGLSTCGAETEIATR